MTTIRLYGVPWSRASRCLWMLEELGVEYENVPVAETRAPEYLAINPNGRVPARSRCRCRWTSTSGSIKR